MSDFYPRSPCGERLRRDAREVPAAGISIHALLAESDWPTLFFPTGLWYFYPRSPCGERRQGMPQCCCPTSDFYPRSPCGERHSGSSGQRAGAGYFYPRSPCGERPRVCRSVVAPQAISIHALLAESDINGIAHNYPIIEFLSTLSLRRATRRRGKCAVRFPNFYPRSPCGERPPTAPGICPPTLFLSTLSLRRATADPSRFEAGSGDFYPRSPCGERRCRGWAEKHSDYFYPRSPCGERLLPLTAGL